MIDVPTQIWAHYIGDATAWASSALAGWWQFRKWPAEVHNLARQTRFSYFLALGLSAVIGAWLLGSINTLRTDMFVPSHSIAGALAGGIVGVELWKIWHGIHGSTGSSFVIPICVGIIVGRFGCLFSGLPDFTYGTETSLPWAVNLGDGIGRHPVQVYEALCMALFAIIYTRARLSGQQWPINYGFYIMIMVYAVQRFFWEFLKPYPTLAGPLNVFHLLMIALFSYGIIWCRRGGTKTPRPV